MTTKASPDERGKDKKPHARQTAQEVKDLWLKGHYTARGYLYLLLLALRKEGWWQKIESVSAFCKGWQINERSFYRAKAALISDRMLEENIVGIVNLRIIPYSEKLTNLAEPLTNLAEPLTNLAEPLTNLAEPLTNLAEPTPERVTGIEVRNSSALIQLKYNLNTPPSHCEAPQNEGGGVIVFESEILDLEPEPQAINPSSVGSGEDLKGRSTHHKNLGEDKPSAAAQNFAIQRISPVALSPRGLSHDLHEIPARGRYAWESECGQIDPVFAEFVGQQLPKSDMQPKIKGRSHVLNNQQTEMGRIKNAGFWEAFTSLASGNLEEIPMSRVDRESLDRKALIRRSYDRALLEMEDKS
jgi:hypothetical protein